MSKFLKLMPVALVLGMVTLSGCAGKRPAVGSDPIGRTTVLTSLPTPGAGDVAESGRVAFIGPFTPLSVEVFGVPELQRQVLTDGEGNFSFPLVGVVRAAGMTPTQVAGEIENRLANRYVREPQVTVNFGAPTSALSTLSQSVTVDGQVARPGAYPVGGNMTLMRTIAAAGGLAELAKLDDVIILRTVDKQQYAGIYNIGAIRRGNYPDPEVYANDVVIVGDSPQRRLMKDLIQISPLLSTPIILLGQNL